eukprot:m.124474 g.124474  ORF g.124474 m.124474 type:complete len:600 (+) comp13500_c0_seq3:31-1830(+)
MELPAAPAELDPTGYDAILECKRKDLRRQRDRLEADHRRRFHEELRRGGVTTGSAAVYLADARRRQKEAQARAEALVAAAEADQRESDAAALRLAELESAVRRGRSEAKKLISRSYANWKLQVVQRSLANLKERQSDLDQLHEASRQLDLAQEERAALTRRVELQESSLTQSSPPEVRGGGEQPMSSYGSSVSSYHSTDSCPEPARKIVAAGVAASSDSRHRSQAHMHDSADADQTASPTSDHDCGAQEQATFTVAAAEHASPPLMEHSKVPSEPRAWAAPHHEDRNKSAHEGESHYTQPGQHEPGTPQGERTDAEATHGTDTSGEDTHDDRPLRSAPSWARQSAVAAVSVSERLARFEDSAQDRTRAEALAKERVAQAQMQAAAEKQAKKDTQERDDGVLATTLAPTRRAEGPTSEILGGRHDPTPVDSEEHELDEAIPAVSLAVAHTPHPAHEPAEGENLSSDEPPSASEGASSVDGLSGRVSIPTSYGQEVVVRRADDFDTSDESSFADSFEEAPPPQAPPPTAEGSRSTEGGARRASYDPPIAVSPAMGGYTPNFKKLESKRTAIATALPVVPGQFHGTLSGGDDESESDYEDSD